MLRIDDGCAGGDFGPVLVAIPFDDDDDAIELQMIQSMGCQVQCSPEMTSGD